MNGFIGRPVESEALFATMLTWLARPGVDPAADAARAAFTAP
jgi:hypothetical protein